MADESEIYIQELSYAIVNIYKLAIEDMGYDMGQTRNEIEYRNYLVDNPIHLAGTSELDLENTPFDILDLTKSIIGGQIINLKGTTIDGVYIPDSVKKNQKLGKCPQEFINGITEASKRTGIPVNFYLAFGALESGWRNCPPNSSGYGGYFGQKASQGGTGSVLQQAQGIMVNIYKTALNDAHKYGFDSADLAVWCYLCHNAGNAGARTMLNALGGKLRHSNLEDYRRAAVAFVAAYGKKWSAKTKQAQINEKTLSIPKAYYIISQIGA